jgi:pentatricopeptide repeat protein
VSHWVEKTMKSQKRGYAVVKKVVSEEEKLREFQNETPEQPSVITLETVNNVKPEVEHLRQFLPVVVVEEELAAVEGRVRRAKTSGRVPQAADCLWLFLANLKLNKLDVAMVSWNDLLAQRTPDILHWNLIFAEVAAAGQMTTLSELYENFKLAVIKRQLPGPAPVTYNILLKAFSEQGDLERVLEIYEDFFRNKWIPELYHLHSITKAAALAGEPKTFHRFLSRLVHKGVKVDRTLLKSLIDSWGRSQLSTEALKKVHLTTGDFAYVLTYTLRVHNYRRAYDLIHDCRDNLGIQPDARMYEVVLSSFISDGLFREEARALKRRFHKYPKGIEVREEHFEFDALFDKVLAHLGKDASDAKPQAQGEQIKFARTTRKASGRLYSARRPERYESGWEHDELEWVPEYVNRKRELKLAQEQADKAQELNAIFSKAKQQASSL